MKKRSAPCKKPSAVRTGAWASPARSAANGMTGIYFQGVLSILIGVAVLVIYLKATERIYSSILIACLIAGYFVLDFLFNMFFGKLVEPIRTMK